MFSVGCDKKEEPNKEVSGVGTPSNSTQVPTNKETDGNNVIIERDDNMVAENRNPTSHIEAGRDIDIRKSGYCNCCRSDQQNVVYWETTFVQSFGAFRAGDKIQYGLCNTCREYCNFPYNDRCTIRTVLKK